jgi:hypothetical protein
MSSICKKCGKDCGETITNEKGICGWCYLDEM